MKSAYRADVTARAQAAYVLEAGEYILRVGTSSRDTHIAAVLTLDETAVTRKVVNICPKDEEFDELSAAGVAPWTLVNEAAEKAAAPVIALTAAKVPSVTVEYAAEPAPFAPAGTDHVIRLEEVRDGKYLQRCTTRLLTIDLCCGSFETAGSYNEGRKLMHFVTQRSV